MPIQRQTAKKVRIVDLVSGEFVKKEGMEPSYVVTPANDNVSRARIVGTVVSKFLSEDGNFGALTIDDTTAVIRAKLWRDTELLNNAVQGDLVMLIGKIREYEGEIYMVPEIIKKITPDEETLARLEILKNMKRQKAGAPAPSHTPERAEAEFKPSQDAQPERAEAEFKSSQDAQPERAEAEFKSSQEAQPGMAKSAPEAQRKADEAKAVFKPSQEAQQKTNEANPAENMPKEQQPAVEIVDLTSSEKPVQDPNPAPEKPPAVQPQGKPTAEDMRTKVLSVIEANSDGVKYSELIQQVDGSEEELENVINELLGEGVCYEPLPGKIKKI